MNKNHFKRNGLIGENVDEGTTSESSSGDSLSENEEETKEVFDEESTTASS
jgi:hypothetical protein